MVAYSFQKRFAEPILAGTKCQTIRGARKRHARPGEELQLYTGMRTKHCRLVGRATCRDVLRITIGLETGRIEHRDTGNSYTTVHDLDHFAKQDGFANWRDMRDFWLKEHAGVDTWDGFVISWEDFHAHQG